MSKRDVDDEIDAAFRRLADDYPSMRERPEEAIAPDVADRARFPGPAWIRAAAQAIVTIVWKVRRAHS